VSNSRLGKGLEALIRPQAEEGNANTANIKINKISPNPNQPRQNFNEDALQELVASIKEKGILTPITICEKDNEYILIAGERRLRAAKLAGLSDIPAYIIEVKDDAELMEMALIENIQRENLNPIEEAEAYLYLSSKFKLSQEAVAKAVGKKRVTVANSLRLLKLPSEIISSVKNGEISAGHGRAILMMKTNRSMLWLWEQIKSKNLSVRGAEALANSKIDKSSKSDSKKRKIDPQIKQMEDQLISALGTKVKLSYNKGKGRIVVNYYSDDDFERLFSILTKDKD